MFENKSLLVSQLITLPNFFPPYEGSFSPNPGGAYYPKQKKIFLESACLRSLSTLIPILAHEYGHHLIHSVLNISYEDHEIFDEGFAFGIERKTTRELAKKRDDELDQTLPNIRAKTSLLYSKSWRERRSKMKSRGKRNSDRDNHHSLGSALFAVLEAERGPDIYRQILHGEFKW